MPRNAWALGDGLQMHGSAKSSGASIQCSTIRDHTRINEDRIDPQFRYLFVKDIEMCVQPEMLRFTRLRGEIQVADLACLGCKKCVAQICQ